MARQGPVQPPTALAEAWLGIWQRMVPAVPGLPMGLRRLVPVGPLAGLLAVRPLRLGPMELVLDPAVPTILT